mmetsp:Transcript_98282/g.277917  ORF Transcript_98282/g.277917 Transcript_98282/m.277917 type:complete len:478 (+) Transcript_98282:3754-5187(+)
MTLADAATPSTFSSAAASFATVSSTIFFVAIRVSTPETSRFHLATSAAAVLNRVWYLMSSVLTELAASFPLASICRAVTNFRVVASAVEASPSNFKVSSAAARISVAFNSKSFSSSWNTEAVSAIFFVRASDLATSLSASCIKAFSFLFWVAVFSSLSLLVRASNSDWNSLSFPCASSLGPFKNRLTSTSLVAMNMRTTEIAVLAAVAAASHSCTAARLSSSGSSSTPVKKGASASMAFETRSVTSCTFSAAWSIIVWQVTRSWASFCADLKSCNRLCDALARSSNLSSSSWASPVAAVFFCWMNLKVWLTLSLAFVMACWACFIKSDETASELSKMLASSARSTSTSAGDNLSKTSAINFCAAARRRKSCRTVLSGFNLDWTSCNFVWNFASSFPVCCLADSLSYRRVLACFALRKMRASPIAFCASWTACSVCVTACFISSMSSLAAVIISEVMMAFSTQSSARLAFASASGRIS